MSGLGINSTDCLIEQGGVSLSYRPFTEIFQQENFEGYWVLMLGKAFNTDDLLSQHKELIVGTDIQKMIRLKKIYGAALPKVLRGDFVMVLINMQSLEVELFKTPFSFKHLYFSIDQGALYISDLIPLLKSALSRACEIDKEKIMDSLSKNYELSDRAFYKGILQLESAERIVWSPRQNLKREIVWVAQDRSQARAFSDYTQGVQHYLKRAVNVRKPIGDHACCEISGGLDSTSVAGILAQEFKTLAGLSDYSKPHNPLGLNLDPKITNAHLLSAFEEAYSNTKIARWDGFSLNKNYSEITRLCVENSNGPEHAPNNMLWIVSFYEFAHQQGFNKLFSGRLGDMAFSFRFKPAPQGLWRVVKPKLRTLKRAVKGQSLWMKDNTVLLKKQYLDALPPHPGVLMDQITDLSEKRMALLNFIRRYFSAASNIDNVMLNQLGVEICDPTSDLDLIEYCLTIPVQAYQRNLTNRYVTRESMKGILPEKIRLNKHKGIQGAHWYVALKRELPYYQSLLPKFAQNDLVAEIADLARLKKLLSEFESWPLEKLTNEHRVHMVHALHVCEWVVLQG